MKEKYKKRFQIFENFYVKNGPKIRIFGVFQIFGLSATLAEYSVPNIRPILTEYSAEYSVFGRTLISGSSFNSSSKWFTTNVTEINVLNFKILVSE